jgi:sec-independent protein translocase protein TatA
MVLAEIFGEQGIIVLIVIALVLFGGTRIPKFARSLGSAKGEFEKGLKEGNDAAKQEGGSDKGTPPA